MLGQHDPRKEQRLPATGVTDRFFLDKSHG